jgi:hypothetical protein
MMKKISILLLPLIGLFACSDAIQPNVVEHPNKITITIRQDKLGTVNSSVASGVKWSAEHDALLFGKNEIPLVAGRLTDRMPGSGEHVDLVLMEGKTVSVAVRKESGTYIQWVDSVKIPSRVHLLSDLPNNRFTSKEQGYQILWLNEPGDGDLLLQLRQRVPGNDHSTKGKVISIPEGGTYLLTFEQLKELGFDTSNSVSFNLVRWEQYTLPAKEDLPKVLLEIGCSDAGELYPEK